LDGGIALVDRHPDTHFIIDHLAILQPRVPPAPPQPWAVPSFHGFFHGFRGAKTPVFGTK
jgi:hypothetical protein